MFRLLAAALVPMTGLAANASARPAVPIAVASIERAEPQRRNDTNPSLIAKAETLLDRARFSPGEIDGLDGDNFRNAVRAFQQANGFTVSGSLDRDTWTALTTRDPRPVLKRYTITEADVAGPFIRVIPSKLEQMARLPGVSYTSPLAELAEKFHMDQALLQRLNPGAHFDHAGTVINAADVAEMALRPGPHAVEAVPRRDGQGPVAATIVVDKPARNVRAYDPDGRLLAFYPATIGSAEKPAPSGVFQVRDVQWNPEYHYDPKFAWKDVRTRRKLTVRPGPNNPVGLVWIDLTAPSYGIHGTPAPDAIGKTESHGCVRLTNWDAVDLAAMVGPGATVRFDDQDSPVAPSPVPATAGQSSSPAPNAPEPATGKMSTPASPPGAASASRESAAAASVANKPASSAGQGKALVSVSGMAVPDYAACVADLTAAKVQFEQAGDVKQQGCELSQAIRLTAVATAFGDIALPGRPTMLCSFARQFSGWVREVAAPLTLAYAGQRLARIETGPGFACRARYDKPGAVPSDHAKGDAIDVVAFVPADRRAIAVKEDASEAPPARDLVHALRMTACGYFTTVLGPGADPAHAEHLHFDSLVHGGAPNYRICE